MDRGRRAEPYSNATIWTREIARNLAGHLNRMSKVHSCVDTASPKSAHLPQFHHTTPLKRNGAVSPIKTLHATTASATVDVDEREEAAGEHDKLGHRDEPTRQSEECPSREGSATPVGATSRSRARALKQIKAVSKRTQLDLDRQTSIDLENQRLQERISKISSAKEHIDGVTYEASAGKPKRSAQDYHKRQEQLKIWEENQALAKRLRNTKPTLSNKKWEEDDKWNQNFLKTQERRRQALQHELTRTLASPQSAMVRVKPVRQTLNPLPSTGNDSVREDQPSNAAEVTIAATARDLRRRRSSDELNSTLADTRRHSTAANHRRIMRLRQQRDATEHEQVNVVDFKDSEGIARPADEVISVRFTFSSQGSRRAKLGTLTGVSGQFSPATELESALEAITSSDDLVSVPLLQPPDSSRLATDDTSEVGAVVFSVLQTCIDRIAAAVEQELTSSRHPEADSTEVLKCAPTSMVRQDALAHASANGVMHEDSGAAHAEATDVGDISADYGAENFDEDAPPVVATDASTSVTATVHIDLASEESAMDASGYGSEFDDDGDMAASARHSSPKELRAVDEYSDDDDGDDAQNDDDVEPDAAFAEPQQYADERENTAQPDSDEDALAYSEDGFANDV